MGLNTALVDMARPIRKQAATARVEGTTQMGYVQGDWFRCRLTLAGEVETNAPEASRRRVVRTPTVMFGVKDSEGEPIDISFEDMLEVNSPQLGRSVWRVNGAPEPIRKKRRVIGYTARLERLEEKQFEELFQ